MTPGSQDRIAANSIPLRPLPRSFSQAPASSRSASGQSLAWSVGLPPNYAPLDTPTRQQLDRQVHLEGAEGRAAHTSFGVQPLEPTPSRLTRAWQGRSRRQKQAIVGGAIAGVAALAVGLGAGLGIAAQRRKTATANSFFDDFSDAALPGWSIAQDRANGAQYRCGFTADAVRVQDATLSLSLVNEPVAGRPTGCGQLQKDGLFGYGNFSARIRPLAGEGVITSLVLYAESQSGIAQEIDLQLFGNNLTVLQANGYRDGKETSTFASLNASAADGPHVFAIDWQPDAINWWFDGRQVAQQTTNLPRYTRQHLFVSTWLRVPSNDTGVYDPSAPLPSGASQIDWVRFDKRST